MKHQRRLAIVGIILLCLVALGVADLVTRWGAIEHKVERSCGY